MIICDNYKFIKKIGKGSFGEVYQVIDKNNNIFACKVEKKGDREKLKSESKIYKRLKKLDCVPKIYSYIETEQYNMLIMEMLGKSIDKVFEEYENKFDIPTILTLTIRIIKSIEYIHNLGIIHRDIKPNNFIIGNDYKIYVVDFGLSKKWFKNGQHIKLNVGRSMIGTARYTSKNIHCGIEASRRDDLESIGYMMVYLSKGRLPWQGLKKSSGDDKIGDIKMMINLSDLCEGMPDCFFKYIEYCRNLQFKQTPSYQYIIELFENYAHTNKISLKCMWEH